MTHTSSFCIHLKPRNECANPACNDLSKATITPGPWRVDHFNRKITSDYGEIAEVLPVHTGKPVANCNLIAAAPHLLAALKQIEARLDRWQKFGVQSGPEGKDSDYDDLSKFAARAIAAAEGW